MIRRSMIAWAAAVAALVSLSVNAADVTGTWQFTIHDTGRIFTPTFTLQQNGEKLSGTYRNSQGDNPAEGTIQGENVTLNAQITGQDGQKRTVTYTGKVTGDGVMIGKMETTRAEVMFIAKREVAANERAAANMQLVREFYEKALNDKDFEAASKYLGPKYVQHNPRAADGAEGLKGFIEFLKGKFPKSHSEIKRIFVDGDHVILHVHAVREPGTRGQAIIDIFRVENGKIVEHWDAVQDVPEQALNDNTMF